MQTFCACRHSAWVKPTIAPSPLPPGLIAVTGDERTGKTTLLRRLAGEPVAPTDVRAAVDGLWLDLALPAHDGLTPPQWWQLLQRQCAAWDANLHRLLVQAFELDPHLDKTLSMLSTGTRRKAALAGLLSGGATVTCLDQPFAALDARSCRVLRDFLADVADHPRRSWVVADYEADPALPWRLHIPLE
jgi:ABC-type multidrug transport system ATPase subunit